MTNRSAFRRHQLTLGDGGRLVLDRDGTIRAFAPDGTVSSTWRQGDPEWEARLRRFGVEPPSTTETPRRQSTLTGGIRP